MVLTRKFSEFDDGGDLEPNQVTAGLEGGQNVLFTNPFPLLSPGTSAERPAPAAAMYYRLRFNTTLESYEYYSPVAADWIQIEDSGDISDLIARLAAHTVGDGASMIGLQDQTGVTSKTVQDLANATIVAQTDNGTLTNGVFLDDLPTGVLAVTGASGALNSRVLTGTANQINISNGNGAANPTFTVSSTLDLPGTMTIQTSTVIDEIIDDDTMATATDSNIPTSESVVNYIASVIGGAAGGLNGQIQYNNAGAFGGDSGFTTDGAGNEVIVGSLNVDNIQIDGNTISATNANGSIVLDPIGTGFVAVGSTVALPSAGSGDGQIQVSGISDQGNISVASYGAFSGGNFQGYRSRSVTPGVHAIVQAGDLLTAMVCTADDGVNFIRTGFSRWFVDAAPGVGIIPTGYVVQIMNAAGALVDAFRVNSNQVMTLPVPLPVGSGGLGISTTPTNGQVPIGNGTNYVAATITAGAGISVTNGSGSITIANTGVIFPWTTAAASQGMLVNNGYISDTAGVCVLTLPAVSAIGDRISIAGKGAGGWSIAQGAGQNVQVGSVSSTIGVGGSVASTNRYDSIMLLCITANTTWTTLGGPQSAGLTIV